MLEKFRLDGKTALITGGNRGIGLAVAHALGEAGAKLLISGRSKVEEAEKSLADQHQIVERLVDRVFDPAADRVLIGRVLDGKHRALEHVRALVPQQAGKLGFLAGFQNEDAVSA